MAYDPYNYNPRQNSFNWSPWPSNVRGAENFGVTPVQRGITEFGLGSFMAGGAWDPNNTLERARALGLMNTQGVGASYGMPQVNQMRQMLASQSAASQGSTFNQAMNSGHLNMAALPQMMAGVQAQNNINPYLAQIYGQTQSQGNEALDSMRQRQMALYGQGIQNMYGIGQMGLQAYMDYINQALGRKSQEKQSTNAMYGSLGQGAGAAAAAL